MCCRDLGSALLWCAEQVQDVGEGRDLALQCEAHVFFFSGFGFGFGLVFGWNRYGVW